MKVVLRLEKVGSVAKWVAYASSTCTVVSEILFDDLGWAMDWCKNNSHQVVSVLQSEEV